MLSEFNYVLVSNHDEGGEFYNTCNEVLDFHTNEYEVCMQEMILTVGAWDNVRDGTNSIIIRMGTQAPKTVYIVPGHYPTIQSLVTAINNVIKPVGYMDYDEGTKIIEFKKNPENTRIKIGMANTDLTLEFDKDLALMMKLIPDMDTPSPIIKVGDKIDTSKIVKYKREKPCLITVRNKTVVIFRYVRFQNFEEDGIEGLAIRINEAIKGFGYLYYDEGTKTLEFRRKDNAMARELDRMMERVLEKRRESESWKEKWRKKEEENEKKEMEEERRQKEADEAGGGKE